MRRRSTAGGEPAKAQRRKTRARKSAITPKATDPKSSSGAREETKVAQLTRELNEARQQLTATADVLQVISRSTFDLAKVLNTLLELAARLCEAEKGAIHRPTGKDASYYVAATYRQTPEFTESQKGQLFAPGRSGVVGRVLMEGKSVQIPDVLNDPEYAFREFARLGGYRTILGVPLLREGAPIGLLVLHRATVRPFTDKQVKLVETFADQAVIAIENVRLFEAEEQRSRELAELLEQQTAISDILRVISNSPSDVQPVLDTVAEHAARICEAQVVDIVIVDNEVFRIAASFGELSRLSSGEPVPLDRATVTGRSICDLQPVHVADLQNASDEFLLGRELAIRHGHRTILSVPLIREGRALGAIMVRRPEVRPFEQKHIALLTTFADQAAIAIENTRLFEAEQQRTRELTESLEQQTATSEVLQVISSSPGDLGPVFASMLENAVRICDAKFGNIYRWDGEALHLLASHNTPPAFVEARKHSPLRPHPETPVARMVAHKAAFHSADMATHPGYIDRSDPAAIAAVELGGARTILAVPMLKENELIGSFSVYRQEVRPFTDKQIALVQNFAAQAVIAIENARLLNELRELLQRQTATADVLKVISRSTFHLQTVLDTLVESAARLCNAERTFIYRPKDGNFSMAASYGYPTELKEFIAQTTLQPDRGSVVGRTALEKKIIHVTDTLADPEWTFVRPPNLRPSRTLLGVPLIREGTLIGVMGLARPQVKPFNAKEIELAATFADQAVIAIENVRLFEAEQQRTRELTEALEQQTATSEVLQVISSSPGELEPVFGTMLENAIKLCQAKFGAMYLYDGEAFRTAALHGVSPAFAEARREALVVRHLHPDYPIARIARTNELIHIADLRLEQSYIERDPRMVEAVDLAGARSLVMVPMLKEGRLIGAIGVYRQEVRPFTDKQIKLVTNFAAQAVIAIENTRLLNELRQRTNDLTESLEQQTATSDVLRVISSSPTDIQPVLETIGERAEKLCDAEISVVSIVDGELIRLASIHGMTEAGVEAARRVYPMRRTDETVTARAIRTRSVCHVADVLSDPQYQPKDTARVTGFRGCLGVPMVRDEQVVGAIFVARRQPGLFSDTQVQLLRTFADQAVIAIENVRLFKETKISLEQQTATADVLKIISRSTFDLRTVLQTLVESAARFCDADKANIIREKDGVFYAAEAYGYSREFLDYIKNIPIKAERGSASGRALVEGRVVHITDAAADPEYTLVEARRLGDYRTILCVPMLREGVPIGLLVLTRSEVQAFTDKQIELVTTYADQAAIAIENVRLFEAEQQRTHELAKSLEDLRTTQDRLVQTQKLASLGQLTAGIAHEIKNPLNFVNNFSGVSAELIDELREALGRMTGDDKTRREIAELTNTLRDNLDKIVQHGKRADAIVKNMLLHSREGSGEHRPVDVNALVEESLNLAYHGARAEKQGFKINMERSFDPAAGQVDVFPQEITRALLNLISNGFYAATKRKEQDE